MQFDAEPVHDGFFHPERAPAPAGIDAHRFHHISLSALPQSVMFCRIRVRTPGAGSAVHLIVYAHHPPLEDDVIARLGEILAAAFPTEVLSFTREMETGRARVTCLGGEFEPAAAAAVATMLAAAAWDESDPIVVTSGEQRFDVSLSFGDRWHARVSRQVDG